MPHPSYDRAQRDVTQAQQEGVLIRVGSVMEMPLLHWEMIIDESLVATKTPSNICTQLSV